MDACYSAKFKVQFSFLLCSNASFINWYNVKAITWWAYFVFPTSWPESSESFPGDATPAFDRAVVHPLSWSQSPRQLSNTISIWRAPSISTGWNHWILYVNTYRGWSNPVTAFWFGFSWCIDYMRTFNRCLMVAGI